MTTLVEPPRLTDRQVRVWFGAHPIAHYTGAPKAAAQFEAGMRRRFVSLRVTNEPAYSVVSPDAADS